MSSNLLCNPPNPPLYLSFFGQQVSSIGPVEDGSSYLCNIATSIAPFVTRLFNLSIQSGKVPTEWKQSLVVPIPKSSDLSSPNNYRPISLLSILSKLLERHIHMLITTHLTENHTLSNAQWGFLASKGTVTALLDTTHRWLEMLENGKHVCFKIVQQFSHWNMGPISITSSGTTLPQTSPTVAWTGWTTYSIFPQVRNMWADMVL